MIYGIVEGLLEFFFCVTIEIFFSWRANIVLFVLSFRGRRPAWADESQGENSKAAIVFSCDALTGLVFWGRRDPLPLKNPIWLAGAFGF